MAMGASSSGSQWIPEDDLLLKKAIESGASFEALAKGAVRFSRRFTVEELQIRWRTILYDPVLSVQASANMSDFERSSSIIQTKHRDFKGLSGKRNVESIRKCYYSMRKRIRNEASDTTLHNFVPEFINDEHVNEPVQTVQTDYMFANQDSNYEPVFNPFPNVEFCGTEDFPVKNLFENEDLEMENSDIFGEIGNSECGTSFHSLELDWSTMEGVPGSEPGPTHPDSTAAHLLALSETLMDGSDQDNILDDIDTEYIENLSSLLMDSPNEGEIFPSIIEPIEPSQEDLNESEIIQSSSLSMELDFPEYKNGVICCVLNTEDTEVPSNDDVFLPVRITSLSERDSFPISSSVKDIPTLQKPNHGGVFTMKREDINIHHQTLVNKSNHVIDSRGVKLEMLDNYSSTVTTRNGIINSEPVNENENSLGHFNNQLQLNASEVVCTDQKGESLDNEEEESLSENEFDMIYTSDVEAMILDMDLTPEENDINLSNKVMSEESKRTIIRLEQAADTYVQRAMEVNGAFGVLYTGISNYFIKKPEVIVGRTTEGHTVDIDLGRECFNKVSRRQACLKLEMCGNFYMKNLGKYSIYVNGKELAPNETQRLTPGCLIEVKGKTLLFEMNKKMIKRYLEGNQSSEQISSIG